MSAQATPELWLDIENALQHFRVTRAELLQAGEDGRIRMLTLGEGGEECIRFPTQELRALYEEHGEPKEANKGSVRGYVLVATVSSVVGSKVVDKLTGEVAEAAAQLVTTIVEQVFRRAPDSGPSTTTRPRPRQAGSFLPPSSRPGRDFLRPPSAQPPSRPGFQPRPAPMQDRMIRPGPDVSTTTFHPRDIQTRDGR